MPLLNDWINQGLARVANILTRLVLTQPSSFACGHATGYKQAILDLDNYLEDNFYHFRNERVYFRDFYRDRMDIDEDE